MISTLQWACLKKFCHCERVAHTGRGNPPDEWNQGTITTKKRGSSHYSWCNSGHFPSNRGIATSHGFLAMTALFERFKQQFVELLTKADKHIKKHPVSIDLCPPPMV